jgi:hypothetical protein
MIDAWDLVLVVNIKRVRNRMKRMREYEVLKNKRRSTGAPSSLLWNVPSTYSLRSPIREYHVVHVVRDAGSLLGILSPSTYLSYPAWLPMHS